MSAAAIISFAELQPTEDRPAPECGGAAPAANPDVQLMQDAAAGSEQPFGEPGRAIKILCLTFSSV